jgi:hypothetical protein
MRKVYYIVKKFNDLKTSLRKCYRDRVRIRRKR